MEVPKPNLEDQAEIKRKYQNSVGFSSNVIPLITMYNTSESDAGRL